MFKLKRKGFGKLAIFSLGLLLSATATTSPGAFADDKTSLDSMWIDQEAPTIENPDDASKKSPAGTVASAGGVPSTVAPMCSFDSFRNSSFVSKGLWPGLGPFKASETDISEMIDLKQNHLKLSVSQEQVTSAQLGIGNSGTDNTRDFLDIEMASDFLLESLGAKPRKIADFNKQLEKNIQSLKPGSRSLSLTAGRFQVILDRSKKAQPYSCLISVNSLDANKKVIAEHSVSEEKPENSDEKTEVRRPIMDVIKKPLPKPKPASATAAQNPAAQKTASSDPKKDEFTATIKTWQQVKKLALKKRDISHLAEILHGTALSKQTTAVKWLQTHGNYYEMDPRGCNVEKYSDLGGGKKYSVIAEVREFSKYMREADNAVLKEVDDKYTVNYTIEKVNDKWMISDSSVVTSANQQSKAPTKTR